MATDRKEEDQQPASSQAVGLRETIVQEYTRIKENAETYPYVWASYILVYGGFGLWFGYRYRALRKTEDRVRALQEKLRQRAEAEESASSAATTPQKAPAPTDKRASSN